MVSSQPALVKLYYEISSPYSYMALTALSRYKSAWNLEIELYPIFMGGIMVGTTNVPPLTVARRVPYLEFDRGRLSQRWGIKTCSPPGHPFGGTSSLNCIRFLRALLDVFGQKYMEECTRLIYLEFFTIQTPPSSPHFFDCLLPVLGHEILASTLRLSQTQRIKDLVRSDPAALIKTYGAFGLPWMVATRANDSKWDVFFGADRIEWLGHFLGPQYRWNGPYPDGNRPSRIQDPRPFSIPRGPVPPPPTPQSPSPPPHSQQEWIMPFIAPPATIEQPELIASPSPHPGSSSPDAIPVPYTMSRASRASLNAQALVSILAPTQTILRRAKL